MTARISPFIIKKTIDNSLSFIIFLVVNIFPDSSCRRCDIKQECENQIKLSDVVIFVVRNDGAWKMLKRVQHDIYLHNHFFTHFLRRQTKYNLTFIFLYTIFVI